MGFQHMLPFFKIFVKPVKRLYQCSQITLKAALLHSFYVSFVRWLNISQIGIEKLSIKP